VLRAVCAADPGCDTDPVADLAYLVRHGDRMLEALATISIFDPSFGGVPGLLNDARNGDTAGLDDLLSQIFEGGTPAQFLSSGLHVATICADLAFPWGDATTPVADRETPLKEALDGLTDEQLWPYDRRTAERVQPISGCRYWPVARASDYSPRRNLPAVPTLLLNGDRDLSTPVEWARWEVKRAPLGELYVAAGAGHGTQARDPSGQAQVVATKFLLG
jgi:pimeloyl-ACP methyl ester carboxylesterase